jgi:hypothetical protein
MRLGLQGVRAGGPPAGVCVRVGRQRGLPKGRELLVGDALMRRLRERGVLGGAQVGPVDDRSQHDAGSISSIATPKRTP